MHARSNRRYAGKNRPYFEAVMGSYMGHIWGHTWVTWEQQWGMHARIHRPYVGSALPRKGGREQQGIPSLPWTREGNCPGPIPSLFRSVKEITS